MNNKIIAKIGLFLFSCQFFAQAPLPRQNNNTVLSENQADYFRPVSTTGTVMTLTGGNDLIGNDTRNLQALINRASRLRRTQANGTVRRGGIVRIPAGNYYFSRVRLASDVVIEIDPDAILHINNEENRSLNIPMFIVGRDNEAVIKNTVITTTPGAGRNRFTVDFRTTTQDRPSRLQFALFIDARNVENFRFANGNILDNNTFQPGISLASGILPNGNGFQAPRNGLIENWDINRAEFGFGLIQVHAATNVLFRNLSGTGGVTLRLESGFREEESGVRTMQDLTARNIRCRNGNAAAMFSPHALFHGRFDVRNITSTNCAFAARIDEGFDERNSFGGRQGTFSGRSILREVKARATNNNAQLIDLFVDLLPCGIRANVREDSVPDFLNRQAFRGPAVAAVRRTANYNVDFNPNTHISRLRGFSGRINNGTQVIDSEDRISSGRCNSSKNLTLNTTESNNLEIFYSSLDQTISSNAITQNTLSIYDVSGKIINRSSTNVLTTSGLKSGIYIVVLNTDIDRKVKKIIIQ